MCSDAAVSLTNISKYYEIYAKPADRLWQMLWRGHRRFYKEFWACADINLEVGKGECLGIIGRNGSGKSTLLQIIAGTIAPSGGTRKVNGRIAALLELGSGFNPDFTGKENVYLNAAILGLTHKEINARYEAIADFADIGNFINQPVKTYSSGMALRLAFAVMANVDADILIIDEALAVGDAFFTQKCMRFLRKFMESHTVIFVSHDMNAVSSLCTRSLLMENGRIKLAGSPTDVTRKYLEDLYEDHQGKIELEQKTAKILPPVRPDAIVRDMRRELVNSSTLRNDLKIWQFDDKEAGFGTGAAEITDVWFSNDAGEKYNCIIGGEIVTLNILYRIHAPIKAPIAGFAVTNLFGQQIFGDNTWLALRNQTICCEPGEFLHAIFKFQIPILAPGEYCVTAALAEGTPENHIQHHWRHEALTFTAQTSSIASGLVGVPMLAMELNRETAPPQPPPKMQSQVCVPPPEKPGSQPETLQTGPINKGQSEIGSCFSD